MLNTCHFVGLSKTVYFVLICLTSFMNARRPVAPSQCSLFASKMNWCILLITLKLNIKLLVLIYTILGWASFNNNTPKTRVLVKNKFELLFFICKYQILKKHEKCQLNRECPVLDNIQHYLKLFDFKKVLDL